MAYHYDKEGCARTAMEVAEKVGDLSGKTFLITGPYSGIGVETTKALLSQRGHVILAGRNMESMKEFVVQLENDNNNFDESLIDADGPVCDLADLHSVIGFVRYVLNKYTKLDVLICNAGIMMTSTTPETTKQGYELQIGTNVIGHYLLAQKLLPITHRQVWVSSSAHSSMAGAKRFDFDWFASFDKETATTENNYDPMFAYQQSKLGNILLAKEFAKRYNGENDDNDKKIEAVSLHPGVISHTNLGRHLPYYMKTIFSVISWVGVIVKQKTVQQGAATTVTCATVSSSDLVNGAHYDDCQPVHKESGNATNMEDAIRLYNLCEELTKDIEEKDV